MEVPFVAARAHLEHYCSCSDAPQPSAPILYAEYCYRRGSYLAFLMQGLWALGYADAGGAVAGLFQDFRHRDFAGREGDLGEITIFRFDAFAFGLLGGPAFGVFPDKGVAGVFAGEKHTAGRRADGVAGVELGEADPLGGELIEVGRFDLLLAITPQLAIPEIVGHEVDDVGFGRRH